MNLPPPFPSGQPSDPSRGISGQMSGRSLPGTNMLPANMALMMPGMNGVLPRQPPKSRGRQQIQKSPTIPSQPGTQIPPHVLLQIFCNGRREKNEYTQELTQSFHMLLSDKSANEYAKSVIPRACESLKNVPCFYLLDSTTVQVDLNYVKDHCTSTNGLLLARFLFYNGSPATKPVVSIHGQNLCMETSFGEKSNTWFVIGIWNRLQNPLILDVNTSIASKQYALGWLVIEYVQMKPASTIMNDLIELKKLPRGHPHSAYRARTPRCTNCTFPLTEVVEKIVGTGRYLCPGCGENVFFDDLIVITDDSESQDVKDAKSRMYEMICYKFMTGLEPQWSEHLFPDHETHEDGACELEEFLDYESTEEYVRIVENLCDL